MVNVPKSCFYFFLDFVLEKMVSKQIYCGDVFEFSPKHLIDPKVQMEAVIDKGCLIALEPHMRDAYFQVIQQFICKVPKCR